MRALHKRLLATAAAMALLPVQAYAADAAQSGAPTTIEEVVVTAQKREQNLQDVAGSISALGAERLKSQGIRSIEDLSRLVPGLDFGQMDGAAFVTLRGIGLAVDTGVAEPNVALHVDGVFLPRTTMETLDNLDLQRIEVLRGPQGTLYGRNATGGAINFVSQAPSSQTKGEASLLVGDYKTIEGRAMITGPLTDHLRGRLSLGYKRRGEGYVDNVFTGGHLDADRQFMVRGALSADLTENLSADLSASYQRQTSQSYQQLMQPLGPAAALTFPSLASAIAPTRPWTVGSNHVGDLKRSTLLTRLGFDWSVTPDIQLKSITAYLDHRFANSFDGDGTSANYFVINNDMPSKAFSQEFDLGGKLPNGGSWLVGAYGFHEDFKSSIPIPFPSGLPGQLPPGGTVLSALDEKTTSIATFGDATIGVTDRLRIYGGARISRDHKNSTQNVGVLIEGVPSALTLSCSDQRVTKTYRSFSPRMGAQYDVAHGLMVYAQYCKGFKSGGLNSASCGDTYDPERLKATEVGFKSDFLDGRAVLNASLFHYGYTGLQVFKVLQLSAVIENADARTYGAEVEAKFQLSEHFRIDTSATLLDAKFTNFQSADSANLSAGVQNLRGARTPRAPKYSANLGVEGNFPVDFGPFSTLTLRADTRWSGAFYFQPFNTSGYRQAPYALVNLNLNLVTADRNLVVRAFMRNVGDKAVKGHVSYFQIEDAYVGSYLAPRTFGVEMTRSF